MADTEENNLLHVPDKFILFVLSREMRGDRVTYLAQYLTPGPYMRLARDDHDIPGWLLLDSPQQVFFRHYTFDIIATGISPQSGLPATFFDGIEYQPNLEIKTLEVVEAKKSITIQPKINLSNLPVFLSSDNNLHPTVLNGKITLHLENLAQSADLQACIRFSTWVTRDWHHPGSFDEPMINLAKNTLLRPGIHLPFEIFSEGTKVYGIALLGREIGTQQFQCKFFLSDTPKGSIDGAKLVRKVTWYEDETKQNIMVDVGVVISID